MADIDEQARALYEGNPMIIGPRWDQLGDVTKSVWREQVERKLAAGDSPAPVEPEPPQEVPAPKPAQPDLFG